MPQHDSLVRMDACAVVDLLKAGEITPHDCLTALEARIRGVDEKVNALPTLCFERAHAAADALMAKPAAERGRLAGLPVPIKDLTEVEGVRTTWGSKIFERFVPPASNILVRTLEAEGGIVYAKSNTPEFGAGANTFNDVFGATLNPWNRALSAAGSSGGAARRWRRGWRGWRTAPTWADRCATRRASAGVVGLRPSPGRVAANPGNKIDRLLGVEGPMARTVEDLALLLDAMTGEHPGDPVSLARPAGLFRDAARRGRKPVRVAFSPDLGITPVDPEVASICRAAADRLAGEGVIVEEAHPDLSGGTTASRRCAP